VPKGVSRGKKLTLVPTDLLERLMRISNREGKTLFSFVSEIFEQALRVYEAKHNLQEVVDFFELMETQKASGAVITPLDVLTYLIGELYPSGKEVLCERWYESGQWYGKYLLDRFHNQNQVDALGKLLSVTRWDLKEVLVKEEDGVVKVRCVSPLLPLENTELLVRFVEGVMDSLGYKVRKEDFMRGIVLLEFEKG